MWKICFKCERLPSNVKGCLQMWKDCAFKAPSPLTSSPCPHSHTYPILLNVRNTCETPIQMWKANVKHRSTCEKQMWNTDPNVKSKCGTPIQMWKANVKHRSKCEKHMWNTNPNVKGRCGICWLKVFSSCWSISWLKCLSNFGKQFQSARFWGCAIFCNISVSYFGTFQSAELT